MPINSFWQNPFGANAAEAGVNPGLMGDPAPTGSGLFGKLQGLQSDPGSRDAMTAFAAQLLAGGGYSPQRQSGSEIFGRALLASQQARAASLEAGQKKRYQDAQIAALEQQKHGQSPFGSIDPDQFTPESLQEFQRSGNYGVLKPRGGLSGIGNFNPGDYTPASFAKFVKSQDPQDLERYVSPAQPSVQIVNGGVASVLGSRTGGAPTVSPISNVDTEAAAAAKLANAKAEGSAVGTGAGEMTVGNKKKGVAALNTLQTLDLADPLIDVATGSATGAAADKVAGFFGKSLDGASATAQLKILQTSLVLGMPRMEGPQSDRDAQLYVEAAGSIGDPTVPRAQKKAAISTIRKLQQRYMQPSNASPSGMTIVPNGTPAAQAADSAHIESLLNKYPPRQ